MTEDEFIESPEYICDSITNGQWTQAVKIFKRGDHNLSVFRDVARERGLSQEQIDSFTDKIMES